MSDALTSIARLRRLVDRLPELGEDGTALADALACWLAGDGVTLEQALNLAGDWRAQDRRQRRDDLIRRLGEIEGGSLHSRATAMSRALRLYTATAWRLQRDLPTLPASEPERRKLLHAILRLDPAPPTSIRQLTTILSVCNPASLPLQTDLGDCQSATHDRNRAA